MRVTLLLARHIVRTIGRQRARTLLLWLALVLGLGVIVGLFSFVSSIDDSFERRGRAISGVSDARVEAVAQSSLGSRLADRLERVRGTRYAVPVTQQRVTIRSRRASVAATAFGIDREARRLRSAMQRELGVKVGGRTEQSGLSLSTDLARRLGVHKRDRVRLFAYQRSPLIRVARVVDVPTSLSDVITLPRARLEQMRRAPGKPNSIYVRLRDGVSLQQWKNRTRDVVPANARVATPADDQRELDQVLDFTIRSSTYMFGAVALMIAGLLIYVLQMMRMLERQEDVGLIRALGSRRTPLVLAEILVLALLLAAAIIPGALVGRPIAHYLANQTPDYLTDVFNFKMQVAVKPSVVGIGAALAFVAGSAATIAALASTRGPVAEQLGRSPQAGATATARVSLAAALVMLATGIAGFVLSFLLADWGAYVAAAVVVLLAIGLATPGLVGLAVHAAGRIPSGASRTLLVARSAIESYPRRAALSATIMALGIAAMVPPQLVDHGLDKRTHELTRVFRPGAQRVVAGDDAFYSVPMDPEYARRVLREKTPRPAPRPAPRPQSQTDALQEATGGAAPPAGLRTGLQRPPARRPLPSYAQPVAFTFLGYEGRRIELLALDAGRGKLLFRSNNGLSGGLRALRRHPAGVLISTELVAGTGLGRGERIRIPTSTGQRSLKIVDTVDDVSWPAGSVYMDIARYRKLYRTNAINMLGVDRRSRLSTHRLADLRPLHAVSGSKVVRMIEGQMDKVSRSFLAMRYLTLLAALVAVGGILATSVFARRREWGVLRAMGMPGEGLLRALAVEVFLIMIVGAVCGIIGGIASFRGPALAFMEGQGFQIGDELVFSTLAAIVGGAILAGTLAIVAPTWLTARMRLADALSYE
ncbi:MAG: FtsX-like permease family protein [Phycisphaeraceae bacterium]